MLLDGLGSDFTAALLVALLTYAATKLRARQVARRKNGHLHDLFRRTGTVRVIVPSKSYADPELSWLTTIDGLAYGWLLKAWSPVMKNKKIDCQSAGNRPSVGGSDTLSIILGRVERPGNEALDRFMATFLPRTRIEIDTDTVHRCSITHRDVVYVSSLSSELALHTDDYSFLAYNASQQSIACFGTSPFGTAGAVSMLVESDKEKRTDRIANLIKDGTSFLAIGKVTVLSEMDWDFRIVEKVFVGDDCQEGVKV